MARLSLHLRVCDSSVSWCTERRLVLGCGGLWIHYSNPQQLFFSELVKQVSVASQKPWRLFSCSFISQESISIFAFSSASKFPIEIVLRAFQIKKKAEPEHPLRSMYISCSLILVLYFYICISLYFYLYQAGPLNNAASGSQEALRSVRWIGKITLGEGMKSSQKPHEILNTISAFFFFLFFFFFSLFIWRARLGLYKVFLPVGVQTPVFVFCSEFDLFSASGRETLHVNEAALKSERRMKGVLGFCFSVTRKKC